MSPPLTDAILYGLALVMFMATVPLPWLRTDIRPGWSLLLTVNVTGMFLLVKSAVTPPAPGVLVLLVAACTGWLLFYIEVVFVDLAASAQKDHQPALEEMTAGTHERIKEEP